MSFYKAEVKMQISIHVLNFPKIWGKGPDPMGKVKVKFVFVQDVF